MCIRDRIAIVCEREKVIDCKGVVIDIDELDNEWKDSIVVEWGAEGKCSPYS